MYSISSKCKDINCEVTNAFEDSNVKKNEEVQVYIEIEQFSNQKYELNKITGKLELDRVLEYPYFYPYA